MSLTLAELKTETDETYKDLILQDWKDKSDFRGITKHSQKDFNNLIPMYVRKIGDIREKLRGDWSVTLTPIVNDKLKTPQELGDELVEQLQYFLDKEARLIDKFAACVKEVQMRKDGDVVRTKLHDAANYYIDYANGTDSPGGTVHDGLAEPADPGGAVYTMVDGTTTATDGTHAVLAINDFDNDTDDNYNGDYLYNITRSTGVIITDYDADDGDDGSVLVHPNIAGQVAGDTFYILRAAKTITKLTTTEVRTAGDVLYLRANITWDQGTEAVDIIFDEDGNQDDYIKIIGCDSVTNDPWVDADDTLPIVDFEDAAYQMSLGGDNYWYFERIDFTQSNDATGAVIVSASRSAYFKTCTYRNGTANTREGVTINNGGEATFDSCTFQDTNGTSLDVSGSAYCKSCKFDAGVVDGATFAIYAQAGVVYCEDCDFDDNAFGTATFRISGGNIYLRNCSWQATKLSINTAGVGKLYSEDDDETFEAHNTQNPAGTITRDTGTVRGGGADSSAKMEPSSTCGVNNPLILGEPIRGFAQVWVVKDVQIDVTVYAAVGSAWDSALTAAECYAKFSYLDHAVNAIRTEVDSTEQITNDTVFTALTSGAFTPLQTGFVYIWLYLEEYEDATEHIFVDVKPVVA